MVNLIRLYQDFTFIEKKIQAEENKLTVDKKNEYVAKFKAGSIFRERRTFLQRMMVWRKPRNLVILLDGCPTALSLEQEFFKHEGTEEPKPALNLNFGTLKDTKKFIVKLILKTKADLKPISNMQFIVIAVLLAMVLVFQILLMRGVTF